MTRPSVYVTVIRTLFGILFVGGSVVHLYGGVTSPLSYGPFGDTAWPPLDELWTGFVMPNIAWLALCMAAFELAVGVTAWLPVRWNRISVIGMTCFFAFLIVLGYAFPTATALEDFLVNRAGSLVMIALVVPWLMRPNRSPFRVRGWRSFVAPDAGHGSPPRPPPSRALRPSRPHLAQRRSRHRPEESALCLERIMRPMTRGQSAHTSRSVGPSSWSKGWLAWVGSRAAPNFSPEWRLRLCPR